MDAEEWSAGATSKAGLWLAARREAVGAEAYVGTAGVRPPTPRPRGARCVASASPLGLALCCDATLVSPITAGAGTPHPRAAHTPGIALRVVNLQTRNISGIAAQLRAVEEAGVGWTADSQALVRQLVCVLARWCSINCQLQFNTPLAARPCSSPIGVSGYGPTM